MTRKKRSSILRSPTLRAKMWESKVEPETYSKYLAASKPLRLNTVAEYQAVHEQLISMVKSILEPMGLAHQTHEYMWYAEELYKASKTYSGNALQNKANTIYAKYLSKKLNDNALLKIANFFGIKPDPPQKIFNIPIGRVSRCIIGFGESGFVVGAGDIVQHQPYSRAIGASIGFVLPFSGVASSFNVYVLTNTLNNDARVLCRKNEGVESIIIIIPSETSGLFTNDVDTLMFNAGDRIDFVVDATLASEGFIDIPSVSIMYEG